MQEEEKLRKATKERIKQRNDEKQKPNTKRCRLKKVQKERRHGEGRNMLVREADRR